MGVGISSHDRHWPQGQIPFTISDDPAFRPTANHLVVIQSAINHWNNETVIELIPRTTEDNFVEFRVANRRCDSPIGMIGGRQFVHCDLNNFGVGSMVHEIGHAVGLYHEQSRQDRDAFVTIDFDNVDDADIINFQKEDAEGEDLGPYDFGSIMHYGQFLDDKLTIDVPPDVTVGVSRELTAGDIVSTAILYDQTRFLYIRSEDQQWERRFSMTRLFADISTFVDVGVASDDMGIHICAVNNAGQLWHILRQTDGSFSTPFDVEVGAGHQGRFVVVDCAVTDGELQICGVNANGQLWHTTRRVVEQTAADGTVQSMTEWTAYRSIEDQSAEIGFVSHVVCTALGNDLHVFATNDDGQLWHARRRRNRWNTFENIGLSTGQNGFFVNLSCAAFGNELHLFGVNSDGRIWYAVRDDMGNWGTQEDFEVLASDIGTVVHSSVTSAETASGFQRQVMVINDRGQLFRSRFRARWSDFREVGSAMSFGRELGFFWRTAVVQVEGVVHLLAITARKTFRGG